MGRREQKKQDKRRRIRQAARELFKEQGYDRTTTRAIAERADIAVGTLFTYYADKRRLLLDVFVEDVETVARRGLSSIDPDASIVDQLMHCFDVLYDYYEGDLNLSRAIIAAVWSASDDPDYGLMSSTLWFLSELAEVIAGAQALGKLADDVAPMQAAYVAFAVYYFGLLTRLESGVDSAATAKLLLRDALDLVERGWARTVLEGNDHE